MIDDVVCCAFMTDDNMVCCGFMTDHIMVCCGSMTDDNYGMLWFHDRCCGMLRFRDR